MSGDLPGMRPHFRRSGDRRIWWHCPRSLSTTPRLEYLSGRAPGR